MTDEIPRGDSDEEFDLERLTDEFDAPADLLEELSEQYRAKQEEYGNSWRLAGLAMYLAVEGEEVVLDSPEDWIHVGLYTRRFDKLFRSVNCTFGLDEIDFESAEEDDGDESVYASMQAAFRGDDG